MSSVNLLCLILVPAVAQWSKLQENGIPRPAGRSVHVAIFDGSAKHYWIHGGSSSTFVVDLWSYDFATGTWDQRQQLNQPPPRGDHVAAWDPNSYTFWVHGGYDGVNYLGDLWKYSGYTWTNIAATGPSPRSQHVAVWDPSNSVIWIHGGINGCVLNHELWKFDTKASTWTAWPSSHYEPLARANHVAVWDDANQAIWIHGGYNRSCGDFRGGLQRDLWRFDTTANSNNWNLIAIGGPTARAYHVAGWDPTNEAIWIHGGLGASFCRDLWRFDVKLYEWHLLSDQEGPSARFSHAAAFDATSTSFCLHGGYSDGRLESDLWCYQWTTTTTSRTTSLTTTSTSKTTSTSLTSSSSITSSSTSSKSRTSTSVSITTSTTITLTHSTTWTKSTTSATTSMSTSTTSSKTTTSATTSMSTSTSTSSISLSSTTSISMSTTSTATVTSSTSTSYTSTSSTQTSSTSKTSSSSSTTLTISSSTSSTRTISTSTSSSTSQTISTSTSSTITITTTTTTTPEDLTAFYILCPLSGLVIVALVMLSLLYAWRYCKAHRFVVIPVSRVAVPQAYLEWPEAPPWCLPPAPPPVGPPNIIPFNTQQLLPPFESPLSPLAHTVPSEPQIQLILPDLHSPSDHETSRLRANDVRINIPNRCAVGPAQPIVEVLVEVGVQPVRPEYQPMKPMVRQSGGQFQDVEACQRCVARETQQAPMLPMPNALIVPMSFMLHPTCRLLDGPRIARIAGHVAPQDESLARGVPELQKCTEPTEAFRRQCAQSTPPMVLPKALLSHPMTGPSLVNVTLEPMVQATARLPATMQKTPVLPQPCIQVASYVAAHLQAPQMPLEEPPPPTVKPKGTTCACEGAPEMELTPITLQVSIPCALDRPLLKVLPSEPRGAIIVREPVALSTPAFVWPSAAPKPQYPLQVASWKPSFETPESLPTSTVIIPVEIPSGPKGYR